MTSLAEAFFKLKQSPFAIDGEGRPVFMTESLRNAAEFVRRKLEGGAATLCVTAATGLGKSSLARALPKLTGGAWHIATLSGRTQSWDEMRPLLIREFGITSGRVTRDALARASEAHGNLVIVVDDAECLSTDVLERICILSQLSNADDQPLVQVLLLADLDAVSREESRPLLAWVEPGARFEMQPLPLEDASRYIDTRLRRVGWLGPPLFSEAGARALHRVTLGSPLRMSVACTDILEQAVARGVSRIDAEFVLECLRSDGREKEEPMAASPGVPLCDESIPDLDDEQWNYMPLTAESINAAASIELAEAPAEELETPGNVEAIESMRSAVRRPTKSRPRLRPRTVRRNPGRPIVSLSAWIVIFACALYTARTEVVEILQEFGMNVPFTESTIDRPAKSGEKNAAVPTSASPGEGDVAQAAREQRAPAPKSATVVGAKRLVGNFAHNVSP